jgi:NADH-quinone oxidoreductase subunit C
MTVVESGTQVPLRGFVGEVLERLADAVVAVEQCEPRRGIARIDPARVIEVARKVFEMEGARLATCTGIDARDGIDVLYHWAFEPAGAVVTLKALAARPELMLDSIADVVQAANWIEREMHDLLGANFRGHPDMRRLILDDSWPEGVHPLRKDFDQVADRPPLPPQTTPPEAEAEEGADE